MHLGRGRGRHHNRQLADLQHKGDAGNGQRGGAAERFATLQVTCKNILGLDTSEWPHPWLAHWQTFVRGRAIENQMFMIACNRWARPEAPISSATPASLTPWGETVIEGDESPQLLVATIDTTLVDTVRARIPVFADRRPELYTQVLR